MRKPVEPDRFNYRSIEISVGALRIVIYFVGMMLSLCMSGILVILIGREGGGVLHS